jgi:hypothetical protein
MAVNNRILRALESGNGKIKALVDSLSGKGPFSAMSIHGGINRAPLCDLFSF